MKHLLSNVLRMLRMKMQMCMPNISGLVIGCVVLCVAGCQPDAGAKSPKAKKDADRVSVMSDVVNYAHDRGQHYTLYDLSQTPPTAIGGGLTDELATGGAKGCCVSLPRVWKPGMMVRVVWGESTRKETFPETHTRDLEIPRYDTPSDLYVVFYPEHEVEVVVSVGEPGHPSWRGRVKQTPWENCLAQHGRKPCKAAVARTFDTGLVGFCSAMKEENNSHSTDLCESAMYQCMQDYEDQAFCDKILWGAIKK